MKENCVQNIEISALKTDRGWYAAKQKYTHAHTQGD